VRFSPRRPSLTNGFDDVNAASNGSEIAKPIADADSSASSKNGAARPDFDPIIVKETFAYLMAEGPDTMEYFYSRLFAAAPDCRSLFPMSMTTQRDAMFAALTQLIWSLDTEAACGELLGRLGIDHRKFGVTERHYGAFFAALRDTVRYFIGPDWRPEVADAWQGALDHICDTMRKAAAADAAVAPPWFIAEIVEHELRSPGVAVLKLAPSEPVPHIAGQYIPVQVTRWPRVWRTFSIANAPRPGGLITLHVRAVPGGLVSNSLVHHSVPGDAVLLGKPSGDMILPDNDKHLLCVAGGTGLAPIKAIIEQVISDAQDGPQRDVTLFVGARQHFDLYDLQDLQLLESAYPGLQVITALSEEPGYSGLVGMLPDLVQEHADEILPGTEVFVCGPAQMVSATTSLLAATIPPGQIHHDPLS